MFMLKSKQQGFTLLELLVVITLLAVLAVGALVAYEDVGDNAEAAAAANANVTLDSAIRTYRAVEKAYPNQWDSLSKLGGGFPAIMPTTASAIFGNLPLNASAATAISNSLVAAGVEELQILGNTDVAATDIPPNRQHNESVNTTAAEFDLEDNGSTLTNISILPSGGATGSCVFETISLNTLFNTATLSTNQNQNKFNDSLESDECHLVVALGFGSDAAASTTNSKVAISQAPTYTRAGTVNPAQNYARYIGLFHIASTNEAGTVAEKVLPKARLVGIITPDGRTIDDAIASAQTTTE